MLEKLERHIAQSQPFRLLAEALAGMGEGSRISAGGVAGSLGSLVIAGLYRLEPRPVLVLAKDREDAEHLREDLLLVLDGVGVELLGGRESSDIPPLRLLASSSPGIVVTAPAGFLASLPPPHDLATGAITVTSGEKLEFEAFKRELERLRFTRKDLVEGSGDYAVRGGLVDIFPFVGDNPLRIEFMGETVESIREFDPLSQRSIRELSRAVVVPDLLGGDAGGGSSLVDYLPPETLVIVEDGDLVRAAYEEAGRRSGSGSFMEYAALEKLLGLFPMVELRTPPGSAGGSVDFGALPQPPFNSSIRALHASLGELHRRGLRVVMGCDGPSEVARLKDLLGSAGAFADPEGGEPEETGPVPVEYLHHSLQQGFIYPEGGFALFTEHQIFNRVKRRARRRGARGKGITERELQQLRRGDYVVHEDFGIGQFIGLHRIRVGRYEQEVVRVQYAERDALYVNLNYINRLQKYSSKEGHVPKLNRLGSPEWERLKNRTKQKVKDIARDLIALYARRKQSPGHAFGPDTPWQKELEASFQYEDTFDQAKATLDIKRDMETPAPMDRLICGDVGFGKTEVAVRAAFKAVMDGRQVAVLVPTTILVMQHFNTFVDRTARYGVQVRAISRFRARQEQQRILEEAKQGTADILIGTHRLLSKDVGFKDLGLLIVDEEHRFGVAAKEKLRQMRAGVDTLALTATPIPRTLHFSLMGARDLSIIATPPRNRLPILTEITQWNEDRIREAVLRELHRGGQVYVVHDRIQKIEEITDRLRGILPGIRIAHAHGQMHAHELEEVMVRFLEKKVDLLVSTKIIESGLDIPNVNTIIINRADRFGMAELYQLRGRVGRSNVQAYAYLLTPPPSVLPQATLRRLQALQEFNELGSGFNLAMRDLEIRGAGNLLGAEQSGFIESMGFETYTRVLEEAVQELKQQEFRDLFVEEPAGRRPSRDTVVEPEFDAMVPESYVPSDTERLALYRRLYALTTDSQLAEIAAELRDRFGAFPPEVNNLFGVVRLRLHAARAGFRKVNISENTMEIDFPPSSDEEFYRSEAFQSMMATIAARHGHGMVLKESGTTLRLHVRLDEFAPGGGGLDAGLEVLRLLSLS
jgi:transcription-repair coupling factor (superfamily II helicase)